MTHPSWLLLAWAGLAASAAAAVIDAAVPTAAGRTRPRRATDAFFGLLLLPLAYGAAFEYLQRADLRTGLLLGAVHAVLAAAAAIPALRRGNTGNRRRSPLRAAALALVYGAVIGFLYVTP